MSSGKEADLVMNAIKNILIFIIAILFGINGNKWREKKLISRGFDYKNTVSADYPETAIALWMKESKET